MAVFQPKVVSLDLQHKKAKTVPPIVNSLRQQARRQLIERVKKLFDGTDDALFELADRSRSDSDHEIYFDAMRQIRLHRDAIEQQFISDIHDGFDRLFQPPASQPALDADDIELVAHDDLEISVAISGIVSKITSQFSLGIMELTRRLDHLATTRDVDEQANPLGPRFVSEAFAAAIERLDIDIKVRIILLKLFERLVMQQMGPVYEQANRGLAQAGVLKDLKSALARSAPTRTPPPPPAEAAADPNATTQARCAAPESEYAARAADGFAGGFGAIQNLLASARGLAGGLGVDTGAGGLGSGGAAGAGSVLATPQLLDLLNAVQAESGDQQLRIDQLPPRLDLRQVVVSRAPDVTGEALSRLDRADEDVVNFIGMLFDYILNDRNLAIPMKALIARLQIPIVKLAIIDKSFFARSAHPARQLLNELSSAGIGWSSGNELKRDAVYNKIESVVLRVLNGFSNNPVVFDELLTELRAFRSEDKARSTRTEARVRETENGRARTLLAKQEVQKVINQKACGQRLPRDLGRYLSDVWSRVLVYASLSQGVGSPGWLRLVETLDELLWSLQPLDSLEQIELRASAQAELLERMREGMELIQLPGPEQSQWLDLIREQQDEIARTDRAFLDDISPRPSDAFDALPEIVLAPPNAPDGAYQGDPPRPDFIEKIQQLSEGGWVEMQQAGQLTRCKLATIVQPGDRYVFVNRRGMKVAEKTRMQLARELQDGTLVVLNDSQVFDRALQAVIGNLRQVHTQTAF